MSVRIKFTSLPKPAIAALMALEKYLHACSLDRGLIELVKLRASQLNGCAYCVDMHQKDARALGEDAERLYSVVVWREAPQFTARERAALAWTEAVTHLEGAVPDDVYVAAQAEFSEEELADLTFVVMAINAWNRLNVAIRTPAGGYRVGMFD